jgi:uncharacterized protein YggE
LLLVALVVAGAILSAPAIADDGPDGNTTISVSASASATAAPDVATVRLSVVERADSAEDARAGLASAVETLRAELDAAGIDDDAISTSGYYLQADYDYHDGEREQRGYVATQSFAVDAPAVDRAGAVIDAAVAGGANRVDGVQFTLSDERRQDLRADVLTDAMDRSRADADAIASAAGLSVVGVESVSTGGNSGGPIYYAEADGRADAGTVIDPGTVDVSVSVSVTYIAG